MRYIILFVLLFFLSCDESEIETIQNSYQNAVEYLETKNFNKAAEHFKNEITYSRARHKNEAKIGLLFCFLALNLDEDFHDYYSELEADSSKFVIKNIEILYIYNSYYNNRYQKSLSKAELILFKYTNDLNFYFDSTMNYHHVKIIACMSAIELNDYSKAVSLIKLYFDSNFVIIDNQHVLEELLIKLDQLINT